jgi:PAS domain S-box-containing protein
MGHYLKKELYELVRSDEKIFEFLQEGSMDGLWYWDLEKPENEWMNERFWTTLGYDPLEMPHLASAWQDIINQDDLKLAIDNFNKHLSDPNHPYDQEVRYTHKNGSVVWIRCRGMAIRDESGNPVRMLGVHQDISHQKHSEEKLVFLNKSITELLTIDNKKQLFECFIKSIKSIYPETIVLYVSVDEKRKDATLETIAGIENSVFKHLQKAVNGKIIGRQYSLSEKHLEIFRKGHFHNFNGSLADFSDNQFPDVGIKLIQKLLKINQVYTIGINKDDSLLGALHLITLNEKEIHDRDFLETYTAHFAALVDNLNIKTQLKESEVKFRTIFEYAPIMIDAFDKDEKCILWNRACENKLGYSLEEINQADNALALFYPDDATRKDVIKTISGEPDKKFREWSPLTKNGKKLSSLWANFRISDEFVINIGIDITKRKETEEALRNSETRFKALHNASFGGITIHDKGVILECNKGLTEISGYDRKELIGMDGLLLIAEESRETVMNNINSGFEKPYEATGLRKNGEKYPLRLEARQIPYQGKNVRVVEFRDITEQKKTESELIDARKKAEESEHKVRSMFENTQIGILYCDARGEILEINPVILDILGSQSEEETKKFNLLSFKPLVDIGFSQNLKRCIENKQRISEDALYTSKWGKTVFMKYYLVPVVVEDKVVGVWANLNNLTDLYNVQKELKDAKEKAEESDRLKSAFLSNMSHEIRTPMNGILGFTELLKEPGLTGDEQEKYIEIIRKSGERMLDTVNDIIDISKIDAGQMEVNSSQVNIKEEIHSLYEFFKEEAFTKGLNMYISDNLPSGNSIIQTDRIKVNSIISNLIKNAIKYTDKGDITILCDKQDSQFFIRVSDTGIGISRDRIQSIFNRFEQADISDIHAREGSGLGLSISQAYTEMLGGTISVESKPGKGSTFTVSLPWIENYEKTIRANEEPEPGSSSNNNSTRILIVEDDDISFEHLSILLGSFSNNIERVNNGLDAVEFVRKNDVDLILMDVKLPVLTGYEATKEIRKFDKDVIIIAQTAYALSGEKENALAAGCNDYISKPLDKTLLGKIIMKYFR